MKYSMVRLIAIAFLSLALTGCGDHERGGENSGGDDFNVTDQDNDDNDGGENIPLAVTATEGEDPDSVIVTWEAVDDATGYQVMRDGDAAGEVDAGVLEYVDDEADAPGVPGDISNVEATDDRGDGVFLSWEFDDVEPGTEHEYTVSALFDDQVGPASEPATGYRGTYAVEFFVRSEDGDWQSAGTDREFLDEDAPYGEIVDPGQARATKGEFLDRVYLSIDDLEISEGPEQSYEVRVTDHHQREQVAPPVTGNRGIADPEVQWQRSNTDGPTGFSDVNGGQSAPYADTSAPAGGMLRYFRAQLWFPGDDPVLSDEDYGFRALDCPVDAGFDGEFGTWNDEDPPADLSTELPTNDANLDALWSAVNPAANFDDPQPLSPAISIDEAKVIATSFRENRQFWLQDSQTSMQVFLSDEVSTDVEVGQKVSFQATEMSVFNGNPQVSDLQNFTVDSSANPVPVYDIRTEEIDIDDHYYQLVRVGGVLENSEPCAGGYTCFDLTYGPYGDRQTVSLRSSSQFAGDGECLTFVGAAIAYPGPKTTLPDDPTIQLQTDLYRWTSWGL